MANLSLYEVLQSQLSEVPVVDGRLVVCTDTGNLYRDTASSRILLGSNVTQVSSLPLAPIVGRLYFVSPDQLYVYNGSEYVNLSTGVLYNTFGDNVDGSINQSFLTDEITDRPYVIMGTDFPTEDSDIAESILLFDIDDIDTSASIDIPSVVLDYETVSNKPSIEGNTLVGNKTFTQLGLESISNTELENLLT